ncbi:transporter [Hymenobacter nivis]|uniref:Transporter n=1 Tax=Hymenobacter nivis TaxID=1850093 RepID=A0A502GHW6_9BACT|nr:transporter [Hymenobacter nivis]TPG61749.1 transporter [Hymenobacter nivis]
MRTTTLWATAALLGAAAPALAQNTPEENNPNLDAPFVRNLRADRPGQTVTAQVLRAGQFQLEAGALRQLPRAGAAGWLVAPTLRIGFFNGMELRVSQPYQSLAPGAPAATATADAPLLAPARGGWAPLVVGTKLMLSPNYDTRTQVALLAETAIPSTGAPALKQAHWAPAARLLVSEQLGQRFGLEANLGFGQQGLTLADVEAGQFLGTLALNGPLGNRAGFFVEGYTAGRAAWNTGATAGLYWRPTPLLRLDLNTGRVLGGTATAGAGLALRLGR